MRPLAINMVDDASIEGIPLDLLISSTRRLAEGMGIPLTIRRRGDSDNGTIFLKINLLDGSAKLFNQCRDAKGRLGWASLIDKDTLLEGAIEDIILMKEQQDPDCWIIEIEDKAGRLWFPGPFI